MGFKGLPVMRSMIWVLGICVFALLNGCAKQTTYGAVKFTSQPTGAEVINLKDDATLGRTPVMVTWEALDAAPEYVTVEMRKSGFREEITSFWVNTRHDSREKAQEEAQNIDIDLVERK